MALPTVDHLKAEVAENVAILKKITPDLQIGSGEKHTTQAGRRVAGNEITDANTGIKSTVPIVLTAPTMVLGGCVVGTDSLGETDIADVNAIEINNKQYLELPQVTNIVFWMYWATVRT